MGVFQRGPAHITNRIRDDVLVVGERFHHPLEGAPVNDVLMCGHC